MRKDCKKKNFQCWTRLVLIYDKKCVSFFLLQNWMYRISEWLMALNTNQTWGLITRKKSLTWNDVLRWNAPWNVGLMAVLSLLFPRQHASVNWPLRMTSLPDHTVYLRLQDLTSTKPASLNVSMTMTKTTCGTINLLDVSWIWPVIILSPL